MDADYGLGKGYMTNLLYLYNRMHIRNDVSFTSPPSLLATFAALLT
jgi:hypothetical protein